MKWKRPSDGLRNRCQTNASLTGESARKVCRKHRFGLPSCCRNAAQHGLFLACLRVNSIRKVVHCRPAKRKAPPPDQRVAVNVRARPGQDRSVRGLRGCRKGGSGREAKARWKLCLPLGGKSLSAHRYCWCHGLHHCLHPRDRKRGEARQCWPCVRERLEVLDRIVRVRPHPGF